MVATARQKYGGRSLFIGDPFEVESESEADDMEAMHIAERAQSYLREDMKTVPRGTQNRKRNRYGNRNLQADK